MKIPTYEELVERCLSQVAADVDKREGSLIHAAVAPVCAELAQAYVELENALDLVFADTSTGEYLDRLAVQAGISRNPAERALCRGVFTGTDGGAISVPLGMRFGIDGDFYQVQENLESGVYSLLAETPGALGNRATGDLLPADYLENLATAKLAGVIRYGCDEESDGELRARILKRAEAPAFGGNIADYRQKVLALDGIGAVRVYPAGDGPGTVVLSVLDENFLPPDEETLALLQAAADPQAGEGVGFAPIGHRVRAAAPGTADIAIGGRITVSEGSTFSTAQENARAAVEAYFDLLRRQWQDAGQTVIRLSQISNRILSAEGILDVGGITLNGKALNLSVGEAVPILGTFALSEGVEE